MSSQVDALAVLGVDAYIVRVEVDVSSNFASFSIVGLPDPAGRESSERVSAAIKNSGFIWPLRRITVNLAPADTKKQGPIFDLPMALGVLLGDEQIQNQFGTHFAAVGELGLDGAVRPVTGVLPTAIGAKEAGKTALFVPLANAPEAAVVEGLDVYPIESLAQAVQILTDGAGDVLPYCLPQPAADSHFAEVNWSDVKGQETVKRALEVAAAGGHNILMVATVKASSQKGLSMTA